MRHYDPQHPIAVFLGPSLPAAEARKKLPANYYPPVRMGDIYRLLATGVQTIAIIDGVFHQTIPVWQREILTALEEGIRVVGGGSMGALRAAELAPFGMEGVGTIFEWYSQGRIDGDDEVALLHADEAFGYRPASAPLVNIRFNLDAALAAGWVTPDDHGALLAAAAAQCFTERSWESLGRSAAFLAMPRSRQDALTTFLHHESRDLKREDALLVLERCAAAPAAAAPPPARGRPSCFHALRHARQCAVSPNGVLVSGEELVQAAAADADWLAKERARAHLQFFLEMWLDSHGLPSDPAVLVPYRDALAPKVEEQDLPSWLRANGLTAIELDEALTARARVAWLLEQPTSDLPLELQTPPFDESRLAPIFGLSAAETRRLLVMDRVLVAWANARGVVCPTAQMADGMADWEAARDLPSHARLPDAQESTSSGYQTAVREHVFAAWILTQGPAYFGYGNWSPGPAIIRELQIAGRCAVLAAALAAGHD